VTVFLARAAEPSIDKKRLLSATLVTPQHIQCGSELHTNRRMRISSVSEQRHLY
jgi:hypothetical protein